MEVPPLVDAKASLAPLYQRLAELARGRATDHVRLAMYGDSNLTHDHVTGELRRTLQGLWGDGGHGWHALSRPWSGYRHWDVRAGVEAEAWKGFNFSTDQVSDRLYGFAGIVAQSTRGRARTWVATAEADAPVGREFSSAELYWLARPKAPPFDVLIDAQPVATIDSAADSPHAETRRFEVPSGPHRFEVVASGAGVRLLGVALERAKAGVVVDSLGVGGVNTELIVKGDRALAIATLRRRRPDLVMLFTGAIEPDSPAHARALEAFIALHREALPGVAILILGPPDLAGGTPDRPTTTSVRTLQVAKVKERVAREQGVAYWDFRAAMGGDGSIVRFAQRKLAWTDFIHLTDRGGGYMGRRLAYALVKDFAAWLAAHPEAGCPR